MLVKDVFKSKGIKATPQRIVVYSFLNEKPAHLSVDDVYRNVKEKQLSISRATVYSILQKFSAYGLIKELKIDFDKIYYDSRVDYHYHFYCNECQNIFDIESSDKLINMMNDLDMDGHIVDVFEGYFYGICKECQNKLARKK